MAILLIIAGVVAALLGYGYLGVGLVAFGFGWLANAVYMVLKMRRAVRRLGGEFAALFATEHDLRKP